MNKAQKITLFLLRVALGGLFIYSGVTKILDPKWSAEGYIAGAKNFPQLYHLFLKPGILPIVSLANSWGQTLLGISLLSGAFVRISAILGAVLMLLYYFALPLPQIDPHTYLVDEHVIYAASLLVLAACDAGKLWGLGKRFW